MIIVLFHVLYLLGKFVYRSYHVNKRKILDDAMKSSDERLSLSEADQRRLDDAYFDDEYEATPIKFHPPAFVQRYTAVQAILADDKYQGKLRKVVDFGCSELGFLTYLKNTAGIEEILCVDIDKPVLEANAGKAAPLVSEYLHCRPIPLVVHLYEGSVTDRDRKLENTDAVICIELIEHLYPDTLTDLPYNIFGYIRPKVAVITTPNADFNVLFPNFRGFRHFDHKFEWTRKQFQDWAENIVLRYPCYEVTFHGICNGPPGTEHLGACSQMAVFHCHTESTEIPVIGVDGLFKLIDSYKYPFEVDNRSDEQKILDDATYYIRNLAYQNEEMQEQIPLENLLQFLKKFQLTLETLRTILEEANWTVTDYGNGPVVLIPSESVYSDYSRVEDEIWGDDDDNVNDLWNSDPVQPGNYTNGPSDQPPSFLEDWYDENWDEEPSIIIPQNNSIVQDNTYLFDGERVYSYADNIPEEVNDFEDYDYQSRIDLLEQNNTDSFMTEPELLNSSIVLQPDDTDSSLEHNNSATVLSKSIVISSFPSDITTQDSEELSFENITVDLNAHNDNSVNLKSTQSISRMLDFQPYMSVSRTSTSPEPLFFNDTQINSFSFNDSISDNDSLQQYMLNSTFCHSDKIDKENLTIENLIEEQSSPEPPENRVEIACNNDQNDACSTQRNDHFDLEDTASITSISNILDKHPQFTSSPRISMKAENRNVANVHDNIREDRLASGGMQSDKLSGQCTKNIGNQLESVSQTSSQSCSSTSLTTTSSGGSSTIEKWYQPQENLMYQKDVIILKGGNEAADNSSEETISSSSMSLLQNEASSEELLKTVNATNTILEKECDFRHKADSLDSTNTRCETNTFIEKPNKILLETEISTTEHVASDSLSMIIDSLRSLHLDSNPQEDPNEANNVPQEVANSISKSNCEKIAEETTSVDNVSVLSESKCTANLRSKEETFEIASESNVSEVLENTNAYECAKETNYLKSNSLISGRNDINNMQATLNKSVEKVECPVQDLSREYINVNLSDVSEVVENIEAKAQSPEVLETPPNSWSPEIMDSGYPNSASAQDMTPEYDLSSIAHDHMSDSESPSVAEAPRLGFLELAEVENGDLANNNRDGEGNNMMAAEINDIEDLQPLIDVLENDLENENDIYVLENGFPMWLLRILEMANPLDLDDQVQRELRVLDVAAGGDAGYVRIDNDEGFSSSSSESDNDVDENDNDNDVNDGNNDNDNDAEDGSDSVNGSGSDTGSDQWAAGDT